MIRNTSINSLKTFRLPAALIIAIILFFTPLYHSKAASTISRPIALILAMGDTSTADKKTQFEGPRFIDNKNGTVTDKITGLVWLKNADCFGKKSWNEAAAAVKNLSH